MLSLFAIPPKMYFYTIISKRFYSLVALLCICLIAFGQADGTLDVSYQNSGKGSFQITSGFNGVIDAKNQGVDKVIILGEGSKVTRIDTTGNIDSSFGSSGIITINWQYPNRIAVDDSSFYIGGWTTTNDIIVQKFKKNGIADSTFGTHSVDTFPRSGSEIVYAMAIDDHHRLLFAGRNNVSGNHDMMVCRALSSGGIDSSFGTNGYVYLAPSSSNDEIWSIGIQSTGKIIVAGESYQNGNKMAIARLDTSGSLDMTFGTNGYHISDIVNRQTYVSFITVQSDDKMVITGQFDNSSNYNLFVARLTASGSLDNTFGSSGVFRTTSGTRGNHILRQQDKKYLVAAVSRRSSLNKNDFQIWRLDSSGKADGTWSTNGYNQTDFDTENDNPRFLWQIPNGKVICLGSVRDNNNGSYIGSFRYHNSTAPACSVDRINQNFSLCEGDSIEVFGNFIFKGGTYIDTFVNRFSCDSIVEITVKELQKSFSSDTIAICDSIEWNGKFYEQSGIYFDTVVNAVGCDSIAQLVLTIFEPTHSNQIIESCDSFEWQSKIYKASGVFFDTTINTLGCDSFMQLHLTILKTTQSKETTEVCDSFVWNNKVYKTSGNYFDTIVNQAGCDSLMQLTLTIHKPTQSLQSIESCDSVFWQGHYFKSSGIYYDTIANKAGCDSVLMLDLKILQPTQSQQSITSCDSFIWNNKIFTSSGVYYDTLINQAGCDSFMTLDLTLFRVDDITLSVNGNDLLSNNEQATYQWLDCENNYATIDNETNRTITITQDGSYAVELTQNGCVDTSECQLMKIESSVIHKPLEKIVKVYPNPTKGKINIDLGKVYKQVNITINDVLGRNHYSQSFSSEKTMELNPELSSGIYYLLIEFEQHIASEKIIID
jgi:uncharacterized delta-60 repeat protein